jgi:hypothetical protein
MKKITSLLMLAALMCFSAAASPAHRGSVQMPQPDGSMLSVCLVGDEFYHFNTTADGYTIKNLHVTGAYGGDQHLAGPVTSSWNANIQNCWVSTSIHCNTTHAGGFIGHAQDSPHTINNCLFDGAISAKNDGQVDGTAYVGAFIGWGGGADNYVTNCLEDGNYFYVNHAGFCYKGSGDAWGNTGNSKNN